MPMRRRRHVMSRAQRVLASRQELRSPQVQCAGVLLQGRSNASLVSVSREVCVFWGAASAECALTCLSV